MPKIRRDIAELFQEPRVIPTTNDNELVEELLTINHSHKLVKITKEQHDKYTELLYNVNNLLGNRSISTIPISDPYYEARRVFEQYADSLG